VSTITSPPSNHTIECAQSPNALALSDTIRIDGPACVSSTAPLDPSVMRQCAWDVGERRPAESFVPTANHVGLAMVSPRRGFAHWRILDDWAWRMGEEHGEAWHDRRMVLRLYDVSYVEFDGLNANRIQDHALGATYGQMFFDLPHSGTWQLAEVGFLLGDGEFVPAARSTSVAFADGGQSSHTDATALLVDESGNIEEVGNLWDQERILVERRTPRLRTPLRIAAFAFPSPELDREGFVYRLAAGLGERGHEVHVFHADGQAESHQEGAVRYHPLGLKLEGTPLQQASSFARAVEERFSDLPRFDLIHLHEWMTATGSWFKGAPTILSLGSIETTRRNGAAANGPSLEIERTEGEIASAVDYILTPDWLRDQALAKLGIGNSRLHAFPMEGRLPNEWECDLDYGQVKGEIAVGPLDRLMMFVGPLEHAGGGDLIIEALPVLLNRWPNLRVAFAGGGEQYGHLEHRAGQQGVGYAVRLLGHVESAQLTRLLRASEAVVLPSRYRVPFDDAVIDLARRAALPVVTTHGGPAHMVRHEETGIITYDNPGSIVWAMDRVLGDPAHARRMGENARCRDGLILNWSEVSRRYLELCAACFPQLTETGR